MDTDERFDVLLNRSDVLTVLSEQPRSKRELVERLGVSRSTVDRAVRALGDAGFVDETAEGYVASAAGRLALEQYDTFRREATATFDAVSVLEHLPPTVEVPTAMVAGSEQVVANSAAPYRPAERFAHALQSAERYRGVLPAVADGRHLRILHDRAVSDGADVELVVPPSVVDHLDADFSRRLEAMVETDRVRIRQLSATETRDPETLPYGLSLVEADGRTTAWLLVYGETNRLQGLLASDDPDAVAWARSEYETRRTRSEPSTGRFRAPTDTTDSLPARLRREGFVQLSTAYFADRSTDPPAVAWRTGLGLPEVYAGFAVERTPRDDSASLTASVLDTLDDDSHCAVVGPPGIGKSTTCKRVACEWHTARDGPVLYRESGRGESFESADALVETVREASGRPLVVIEDAVRAGAVGEVVDRLEPTTAAVLLDAREAEWREAAEDDRGRQIHDQVEPLRVPTLSEGDRERLLETLEATLDVTVPAGEGPSDELDPTASADTSEATAGAISPEGSPSMFLHQIVTESVLEEHSSAAGDEGVTAIEAEFDRLAAELTALDAFDVGVVLNLLNAAGLAVDPTHVHALAGEHADEVLDRLEGTVFFGTDGEVQVVHHAWSISFLRWLADRQPERAAAAADTAIAGLVRSVSEPAERARLRETAVGEWLDDAVADPDAWVETVARRLFGTLRSLPALAPVFDAGDERIHLPDGVSVRTELDCRLNRAKAQTDARHVDRAAATLGRTTDRVDAASERLDSATEAIFRARIETARGTLARQRGAPETAASHYREALDHVDGLDCPQQRGRACNGLGVVAGMGGDIDAAVQQFETALTASREAGDTVTQSNVLRNRGNIAVLQGDYETAVSNYEESIDIARRHGLFTALAGRYVSLGEAQLQRSAFASAAEAYTKGLQLARRVGAPGPEANALGGLGELALERGELDEAEKHLTRAVELFEELERPRWLAESERQLGVLARRRGEPESALEYLRSALATAREADDDRLCAQVTTELGFGKLDAGAVDDAREQFQRALQRWDETGLEAASGRAKHGLAAAAYDRGALAEAERYSEEALSRLGEEAGARTRAEAAFLRGRIAAAREDPETARDHFSTAAETFRTIDADERVRAVADRLVELCDSLDTPDGAPQWARTTVNADTDD